jgi:hypothetical protein
MQDEVLKHTKKIYDSVKNKEHSLWEKVREVVVEILIIVFAVTLSIWLHNWSDHRAEQKQTNEFLAGLRVDLAKDIDSIGSNRKTYQVQDTLFKFLDAINQSKAVDTMSEKRIGDHYYFQMCVTHFNFARYDGFKSNGKIETIENDSLRQAILTYYQQTVPAVNDLEAIVNSAQEKLMDAQFTKDEKMSMRDFARSFKSRAYVAVTVENIEPAIHQYADAEEQAKQIINRIDAYLKGRE